MNYVDVVAMLAVAQYIAFSTLVGKARIKYGVKAPAVTGLRTFRACLQSSNEHIGTTGPPFCLHSMWLRNTGLPPMSHAQVRSMCSAGSSTGAHMSRTQRPGALASFSASGQCSHCCSQASSQQQLARVRPNPSVKASPNSCARKARLGQSYYRPCRALRAPL